MFPIEQYLKTPELYDACTWVGDRPFGFLRYNRPDTLKEKLSRMKIVKAVVSPLNSLFSDDPLIENRSIVEVDRDFFIPAPVVDLSRANWTKIFDFIDRYNIKVVKLLPNYHMYRLRDVSEELLRETTKREICVSIQVRMEDERGQYKPLNIKAVDINDVVDTVKKHTGQKFLVNGMYVNEIKDLANFENVFIDVSAIEGSDIYKTLCDKNLLKRVVFGTHTPLFFPEGNVYKLSFASINDEDKKKVAMENLKICICI